MSSGTRGLGRGLAAILHGGPGSTAGDTGSVLGRLVDATARGLATGRALTLNGYLHLPDDGEAELHLAAPRLGDLHPTEAWQVCSALHQAITAPTELTRVRLLGGDAVTVRTHGPVSQGIHVVAADRLDATTVDLLVRFCAVWAPVLHGHALDPLPSEKCELTLDQADGTAHVELRLGHHTGFGSAPDQRDAVAQATLAALDDPAKPAELTTLGEGAERCVVVTIATADGATALGAAPIRHGELPAVAVAVQRASRALAYGSGPGPVDPVH